MKIAAEMQSAPIPNRETEQPAVFLHETRRTKGRESRFPRSSLSSFMPRGCSGLKQAWILLFELLAFPRRQKSQGIGNRQNLAFQNCEAAIPNAFFPAEGLGQRQEHSHLRH